MRTTRRSRQRRVLASLAGAVALASSSLLMAACNDEPDNLGEAIEEVGDEIEDAGDEIEDEIDDHS
jgi:hypothetical protein